MNGAGKLALFCRYDENGASSRLRFFRYRPFFEKAGIETVCFPFFDAAYLERRYSGFRPSPWELAAACRRRLGALLNCPAESVYLIEYELFPWLWPWAERLFLKKRRWFLNFDDPVWEKYAKIPALAGKYDALVRRADGVIAANDLLMKRFGKLNDNIIKIPTAIDLDAYTAAAANAEKFPKFTLAWIGSPATFPYLERFAPVLRRMRAYGDFELLMIGKASWAPLPGVSCRSAEWSEAGEAALLARCHAGIMPLPDEAFARGKSAYKLIQYAGAGIPALASPVGENVRVVRHGKTGFLCNTPEEWGRALQALMTETHLREEMGRNARNSAEEWSLAYHAPRLVSFLFPGREGART